MTNDPKKERTIGLRNVQKLSLASITHNKKQKVEDGGDENKQKESIK